jgi:hypothetical protein
MNGTSGFQEVRPSTSRSPSYRFLHKQQCRFGTGAWYLFRTKELPWMAPAVRIRKNCHLSPCYGLIAPWTDIGGSPGQVSNTFLFFSH